MPPETSEFSVIKNKSRHSHGNVLQHIYCPQSIQLIARNACYYWRCWKLICSEESGVPRISVFYLVSVITVNHIKKWFSMHFLKLLIWFLMLRVSLIGFLILGNGAPHGTLSLGGDWKVLCTNPLFHGSASVTKSVGKCCRQASTAQTFREKQCAPFFPMKPPAFEAAWKEWGAMGGLLLVSLFQY